MHRYTKDSPHDVVLDPFASGQSQWNPPRALNWVTSFELAHVFWDLSVLTLFTEGRSIALMIQYSFIDVVKIDDTTHQGRDLREQHPHELLVTL